METHIFLNAFIEKFYSQGIRSVTTFSELYDEIISESYQLQKEIKEKLISLHPDNKEFYLNYVKERINVEILGGIDSSIIDKWTVLFDLNKIDFPFIENEKIKTIVSTWIDQPGLNFEKKTLVKNIQHDFYFYTFFLEANRIITFIDQLLQKSNNSKKSVLETPKFFKLNGAQATIKDKATDLHNSLVSKNYINEDCKKDFVKLFTGQKPESKIIWLGLKSELKLFINFLIDQDKIENCNSKWIITAANFKYPDEDVISDKIKDLHKVKNESKIKNIVTKI
nr:hypothetical protein [uncultured Flavobacterium sp.]